MQNLDELEAHQAKVINLGIRIEAFGSQLSDYGSRLEAFGADLEAFRVQ
jgi:hypothetical protein